MHQPLNKNCNSIMPRTTTLSMLVQQNISVIKQSKELFILSWILKKYE
jgi:hypothetical protein